MTDDYFIRGRAVVVSVDVYNRAGVLTDPAGLTLRLSRDGTEQPSVALAAMTKVAVGRYEYEFVPSAAGLWRYRFESTTPTSAAEGDFRVSESSFSVA